MNPIPAPPPAWKRRFAKMTLHIAARADFSVSMTGTVNRVATITPADKFAAALRAIK